MHRASAESVSGKLPRSEWQVLIPDHHPGLIDWRTYDGNQDRIATNTRPGTAQSGRRRRHQQFIRFLNAVEDAVPAGKVIHAIVDNYAAYQQPNVLKWLADHPRWTFHFTPTAASWLNAVEGFFSAITRRQIRRGAFHSVDDLQNAVKRYIDVPNGDCRPFVRTSSKNSPRSLHLLSESVH
jgi:transposase